LIAIVGGGVLLIAIALVLALGGGRGAQTQVASSPTEEPGASNIPYPSVERISPEETHAMVQNGEAIIVDVRDQAAFEAGHAAGALSLPEAELADRLSELPRQQMIITYCT
jgi:3-mercaptopyruvate sulfurtransferase SseA